MVKSKVYVIYDCPRDKCDKMWVANGLKDKGYDVKCIFLPFRISHLEQRGKIGKYLSILVIILQCLWALLLSEQNDILFCWLQRTGIYCNKFALGKRKIISYNWLTPTVKQCTRKIYADALENPRFQAVINAKENKEKNLHAYQAKDIGNITYIPDVFDTDAVWRRPDYKKLEMPEEIRKKTQEFQNRYCFMGGRNNRDWSLFLKAARQCPEICFVGIAVASDWDKSDPIPDNVIMMFDTPPEVYYQWMQNAYLAVFPLTENKVSGLINIIKGTMEGIPVLITRLEVTSMYYDTKYHNLLFEKGDCDDMCSSIQRVYVMDEETYCNTVTGMQEFIRCSFSPQMAVEKIISLMIKLETI